MKSSKNVQSSIAFAKLIWSNILRQQYLHGVTDRQLSDVMGVTTRTLYNYRHDPSSVTVKQLRQWLRASALSRNHYSECKQQATGAMPPFAV